MKNKNSFILSLILVCIFAVSMFVVMGGLRGESAYELAVKNGFVGTETEWLNSLKGGDGEDAGAIDYMSMYTSCKESGEISSDTSYLEFIQSLIDTSNQDKQLLSIHNSIRSSVSIFNLNNSSAGSGSFFRIDDDGTAYIVTNFHVTYSSSMPEYYYVLLYEDNYLVQPTNSNYKVSAIYQYGLKATYVGGSKDHDIAVIKIAANDRLKEYKQNGIVAPVTISQDIASNKADLVVGTSCYAIGNGMGEGISAAQGIVSVTNEEISLDDVTNSLNKIEMRLVRTTCLINGGNSGGGLFNLNGELIGVMNSKRDYQSETNSTEINGVTYAIPVSVAYNVYNRIMDECNSTAATTPTFHLLGVQIAIDDCTSVYNTNTGLIEIKETIKLQSTTEDGNANGKLLADDILVSYTVDYFDNYISDITTPVEINHLYTLSDIILTLRSGDTITVNVLRTGATVSVPITIA